MLYELELYALIAVLVFSAAGFAMLCVWLWDEVRELVGARRRVYARLAMLTSQPRFFANPLAISRTISRNLQRSRDLWHTYQ
jgi:hypothetical protein